MAAGANAAPVPNGTDEKEKPVELAFDLPHSPGLRVHLHLTVHASSVLLFLTSANAESSQSTASMGSLVYAMPDRYQPNQPMSTVLYSMPSSVDFTTRIAKVLVRRLQKPCYVGSSVNLSGAMGGGSVDEEMEAFRGIVDVVSKLVVG